MLTCQAFISLLIAGREPAEWRPPAGHRGRAAVGHGRRAGRRHSAPGGTGFHTPRRRQARRSHRAKLLGTYLEDHILPHVIE